MGCSSSYQCIHPMNRSFLVGTLCPFGRSSILLDARSHHPLSAPRSPPRSLHLPASLPSPAHPYKRLVAPSSAPPPPPLLPKKGLKSPLVPPSSAHLTVTNQPSSSSPCAPSSSPSSSSPSTCTPHWLIPIPVQNPSPSHSLLPPPGPSLSEPSCRSVHPVRQGSCGHPRKERGMARAGEEVQR
jgi:hypothetical protein